MTIQHVRTSLLNRTLPNLFHGCIGRKIYSQSPLTTCASSSIKHPRMLFSSTSSSTSSYSSSTNRLETIVSSKKKARGVDTETVCSFGGNTFERANHIRENETECLKLFKPESGSMVTLIHKTQPLLEKIVSESTSSSLKVVWLPLHKVLLEHGSLFGLDGGREDKHFQLLQRLQHSSSPLLLYFIGLSEKEKTPLFALDVSELEESGLLEQLKGTTQLLTGKLNPKFHDLRNSVPFLSSTEIGIMGQVRSVLEWNRSQRFCGRCGSSTHSTWLGSKRICSSASSHEFYPRTDPVAIMAVINPSNTKVLLGRQSRWAPGVYSTLAGFLEPGETIEAAVRRESLEEAGVQVAEVTYLKSQPWPFPHSQLMIGCIARAISEDILVNREELEDAGWYTREDVQVALESHYHKRNSKLLNSDASSKFSSSSPSSPETGRPLLKVPPPFALSHQLLLIWALNQT